MSPTLEGAGERRWHVAFKGRLPLPLHSVFHLLPGHLLSFTPSEDQVPCILQPSCSLRFTLYPVREWSLSPALLITGVTEASEDSLSKAKYKQTPLTILRNPEKQVWRRLKNVCKVAELGGGGVRVPAQIHLYPKLTPWSASKPGPQSLQVEQVNNHTASWTVGKAHGVWGGALPRAGHKTQELRFVEG